MTIQEIHNTVLFYLNKDQNSFVTHEEIDLVLDKAQLVLFNQYHTNPKMPAQAQAALYGESQRLDDALSPFKAKYTFTGGSSPVNITSYGIVTLPSTYMHFISMYTTMYNSALGRNVYSAVQVLNEEELIERLNSQIIPVSEDDPIAIMNSQNKIQLFPEAASSGGVYYFRRPLAPKFDYVIAGRTVIYKPVGDLGSLSVNLEWKDIDIANVIAIALSYFGLNLSSADIMQFAEAKIQSGQ